VQSNVELAKGSFDAFNRGDAEAYVNSFSEDVEWEMSSFVTGRGDYKGREGVREFLAEIERLAEEQGERLKIDLTDYVELPDGRVAAFGAARIDRASDPLEFESAAIWTFGDGVITRLEGFTSHEAAREAAGLDE
jgi:ketosteroid isomerase-like protein